MNEEFSKLAQEAFQPVLKLAENNTALTVQLLKSQSDNAAELLQENLAQVKALAGTRDLNKAVELQQKFSESVNEKLALVAKNNAAAVEAAIVETGKILESSMADAQSKVKAKLKTK